MTVDVYKMSIKKKIYNEYFFLFIFIKFLLI